MMMSKFTSFPLPIGNPYRDFHSSDFLGGNLGFHGANLGFHGTNLGFHVSNLGFHVPMRLLRVCLPPMWTAATSRPVRYNGTTSFFLL